MKKIMYLLVAWLMVALLGCGAATTTKESPAPAQKQQEQVKLKTAEEISTALKAKGLPIGTVIVYTAETDTNKLLGRPNQYVSKVKFTDTSLKQSDANSLEDGAGSVEFFTNAGDVKARKDYIDNIGKKMGPLFIEYSYINGDALLRINKVFTPDQAAQYEKVFKELKI